MFSRPNAGSIWFLFLFLVFFPNLAVAQTVGGIAGSVKDTSGGALPGVSVEASSPALIEKVRTVITDGQGNYQIINLPPGVYMVTFTLSGFGTLKQEGIELTSSGTMTVNADLRVGTIEESVTVSGEAPTVDIRNVAERRVLQRDVLDALPVSRSTMTGFAAVTTGIYTNRNIQDVGGTNAENQTALAAHGSRPNDAQALYDGMTYNSMMASGAGGGAYPLYTNQGAVQEISIEVSANSAESPVSGVRTNLIPKEGGNNLKGSVVGSYAPGSWQSNNASDALRARGLQTNTKLIRIYDFNPTLGGALMRDKLWFFAAYRYWGTATQEANTFYMKDPLAFVYTPDLSRPGITSQPVWSHTLKLTWQASQKHKIGYFLDNQDICRCVIGLSATTQPEATTNQHSKPARLQTLTWTAPLSNKIILDAGANYNLYGYNVALLDQVSPTTIGVLEQTTGMRFRAPFVTGAGFGSTVFDAPNYRLNQRFSMSYVPGSHVLKVGFQIGQGVRRIDNTVNGDMTYTLSNGVPNRVDLFTTPYSTKDGIRADLGIFAQDQWTMRRLTLNYGARFDYFNSYAAATNLPATRFVGPRVFPEVQGPRWKDISPRFGAAYDLFGEGQTAVKVSVGRYLAGEGTGLSRAIHPVTTSTNTAFRTFRDLNGNYIPDCNLTAPQDQPECGPISDRNFGNTNIVNHWDPDLMNGWGKRGSDWEVGVTMQHAVTRRISVSAGYYHRWFQNFFDSSFARQTVSSGVPGRGDLAVDNLAVTPADFDPYCITSPVDPRLPGGGGQRICGLYDLNPTKFGLVDNLITFKGNYGKPKQFYDAVDVTFNARLPRGSTLSGGASTGRMVYDNCVVIDSPQALRFCKVTQPFQPQFKVQGLFPLLWGIQASTTWQNLPGNEISAIYTRTSAQIAPELGRPLSTSTVSIDLIPPGTMFENRINQLDARLGKSVRIGRTRVQGNFDMYNLFNANTVLGLNNTYGQAWLTPTSILAGRLFKATINLDF
jgi:hypothetical protein